MLSLALSFLSIISLVMVVKVSWSPVLGLLVRSE